jgi:hypothetical protein
LEKKQRQMSVVAVCFGFGEKVYFVACCLVGCWWIFVVRWDVACRGAG